MTRHASLVSVLASVCLATSACKAPNPPVLTPQQAALTGVTNLGIDLKLRVDAFNPNNVDLTAQGVTAKVVAEGKYDMGTVTLSQAVTLPKNAHTPLDWPISAKWKDVTALAVLALSNKPVSYTVEGTAAVGTEKVHFDVPFKMQGTITHEQLAQAAASSLPNLPLGMPVIPH